MPSPQSGLTSLEATCPTGWCSTPSVSGFLEIGEAVKAITPALLGTEPEIPWKNIAAMRDQLAHRYFDTEHAIVSNTVTHDLEPLLTAVLRLKARVASKR